MSDHIPYPAVAAFFGRHVQTWCAAHGGRAADVARLTGSSESWVSRLTAGRIRPDPSSENMIALMDLLDLTPDQRREALGVLVPSLGTYLSVPE